MLSSKLVDLLTVGEGFDDIVFGGLPRLPRSGEEMRVPAFASTVGGGAIITAVAAARLGLRVGVMSAVGGTGAVLLKREGVDLINVLRAAESPAVSVALSTLRNRSFVTFEGVNRVLEPRLLAELGTMTRRPRHVHFALSPRNCRAWIPLLRRMRAGGISTSWDFGWNDGLAKDRALNALAAEVGWLFMNEQEDTLYSAARRHARRVVVKRGARGAILYADGTTVRRQADRARVVDTTGAGDAFNGGFLTALQRHADAAHALRLATYVGARATEALGGIAALPARHELPAWARRILENA
jgi:sugar/nucleoside kinase (ribokinase family)